MIWVCFKVGQSGGCLTAYVLPHNPKRAPAAKTPSSHPPAWAGKGTIKRTAKRRRGLRGRQRVGLSYCNMLQHLLKPPPVCLPFESAEDNKVQTQATKVPWLGEGLYHHYKVWPTHELAVAQINVPKWPLVYGTKD